MNEINNYFFRKKFNKIMINKIKALNDIIYKLSFWKKLINIILIL